MTAGQVWKIAFAVASCVSVTTPAAFAADYPYSGRMTLTPAALSTRLGQMYCAYNFFFQRPDGSFTGYHLDLARFRADGTVRYVVYQKGTCTLDASNPSVESCLMSFDTDPAMQGKTFVDTFRMLEGGAVGIFYFESVEGAREFAASNDTTRPPDAQFVPCEDPGGRPIDTYLTDEASTLSPEDRAAITSPEFGDAETADTMLKVLDKIFAGQ